MGFSCNKVTIVGNLGRDAETRTTDGGLNVTNFSVVTEHSYKDKNDDWQSTANWHNCVAFGLSDWIRDRLVKGATLFFEGRISNTSYNDKDGNKKYKSEIIVDKKTIIPFAKGESNSSNASGQEESSSAPQVAGDDDLPF